MENEESNSDRYTVEVKDKETKTPAERGVHRRRLGIWMLIFAMVYGTYALIVAKDMNEIFISSIIVTGGTLLGIGKVTKDKTE